MNKYKRIIIIGILSMMVLSSCMKKNDQTDDIPVITPTLTVDFSNTIGKIKPLNGINNGPKSNASIKDDKIEWGLDMTKMYRELDVPYVRTHDMEYPDGSDMFIDIHCIFPDFSRKADDADAYDFSGTDEYIANIQDSGAKVFYRLGESIATSVNEAKYQYPPEDYEKWAEVCGNIIAHYNEGWNDGFEYGIEYWEIWNEPDQSRQWIGKIEDYYKLYQVTARYLKELYPDIHIGGGVLASASEESVQAFLDGITDDGEDTPLDFFSWHIYTDTPSDIAHRADLVRKILDQNGYNDTTTFLDEWNYVDDWTNIETTWEKIQSPEMASFYAACMIMMQNSNVDAAMYYDGTMTGEYAKWCGLYTSDGKKLPGYYGIWSFSQLRNLKNQVKISYKRDPLDQGVFACAASGEKDAILLANTSNKIVRFCLLSNSVHSSATYTRVNTEYPDGIVSKQEQFTGEEVLEMQAGELLFISLSEEK
ncbi:MAG: hypothetical protein MR487_07560 [Lachnospiraceae bacterium]|nr:hypothetical protein [Lachnospiraceae bacterium]